MRVLVRLQVIVLRGSQFSFPTHQGRERPWQDSMLLPWRMQWRFGRLEYADFDQHSGQDLNGIMELSKSLLTKMNAVSTEMI
jgi:hypothetical protein